MKGFGVVLKCLLALGAQIQCKYGFDQSPVHYACRCCRTPCGFAHPSLRACKRVLEVLGITAVRVRSEKGGC